MAAATKKRPSSSSSSKKGLDVVGALKRKIGPLPAGVWLLVVGGAIYLWRRHTAAASSSGTGLTTTTGGAGSDYGAGSGSGSGGGSGAGSTPTDPGTTYTPGSTFPDVPLSTNDALGTGSSPSSGPSMAAQMQDTAALKKRAQTPVAATNPNFAQAAEARTAAGQATGTPVPFGGVVSTTVLKNNATLTTYANGRTVEQAPGKSAYVTSSGGATGASKAAPPPPASNAHKPGVQM